MVHKDSKEYCSACDVCQRTGRPSRRDELPLNPQVTLQVFDQWEIDFVGPTQPPGKKMGARYIITATKYLTRWAEAQPMKDCSADTMVRFIFKFILSRFGCPKILMSEKGSHFLNETIATLTEEFHIYHQKSTPYHPQVNGTIEAFNKSLENTLKKVCNVNTNDLDVCIPTVLWAYRTTCKKLTGKTTFRLVYEQEALIPMEYIMPSLQITIVIEMEYRNMMEECLALLLALKEDHFLVGFHQQVQKAKEKAWHDCHIKQRTFKTGDLILMYDNKFTKFSGKFQMHWLGLYVIKDILDGGIVQLAKLNRELFTGRINGRNLKVYKD